MEDAITSGEYKLFLIISLSFSFVTLILARFTPSEREKMRQDGILKYYLWMIPFFILWSYIGTIAFFIGFIREIGETETADCTQEVSEVTQVISVKKLTKFDIMEI